MAPPRLDSLLQTLYPIPPLPQRTRSRTKPMRVLCLGLGRTGTDSLRNALLELGYGNVYHGSLLMTNHREDLATWTSLGAGKVAATTTTTSSNASNSAFTSATTPTTLSFDYDRLLADCAAVTDAPTCHFGLELLRFYPHAKVILNQRSSVAAWKRSFRTIFVTQARSPVLWVLSWFDAEVYWICRSLHRHAVELFGDQFEANAEGVYAAHYESLREECRVLGREWLEWTVEDGWGPLCGFLGEEVPEGPFPSGNNLVEYDERFARDFRKMMGRAAGRMVGFCGVLGVVGYGVWLAL